MYILSSLDGPGGNPIGFQRCVKADNVKDIASKNIGV